MANYTPTFTKPYPSGWVDKPSKTTPATAAIMNSYDTAIAALEAYLRDNAIDTVSVSVEQFPSDGRQWIGTITVGSDQYRIYMPSLKYENSVSDGIKIGTITLGEQSFDVYAPSSSTGGSNVSVVPKTLTGTNIAEITVDGTTYQLYAPTSGGGSVSTVTAEATLTEGTQIGKITIDGTETILYAPTSSQITVDSELSATSENAIQNKAVDAAVKNLQQQIDAGGAGGSITVDSALSATSENPVQNKVVTAELDKKLEVLGDESQAPDAVNFDLDSELSLTSVKGVQNKAIAEEFQKYANGTKVVAKAAEAETAKTAASATTAQSATTAESATKATQDAKGNVIDATYAKKTEVPQGTVVDDALSSTSTNPVQNKVVKAEFDSINSNLSDSENASNYGNVPLRIIKNSYYDKTNGSALPYDGWSRSELIKCKGVKTLNIKCSVGSTYNVFLNDNKQFVSSFTITEGKNVISVPFSACYVGFSGKNDNMDSIVVDNFKLGEINESLSALGKCKNLLKPTLQTATQNGVTCTANKDGTYTLNGTATAEIDILIGRTIKTFKKNTKLKIAGMPTTGKAFIYDSFNSLGENSFAYGFEGKEYQTNVDGRYSNFNLHIPNGTSLPNVIIRPMIVENLNATYDDFVPYTGEGDTLTADVAKINSDLSNLKDGTTPVAKAVADEDGNNIKNTYAKKTETSETVTEDVNVVLNSDLFDSVSNSNITCIRIGKLCVLSFTIHVKNTIYSTTDEIVLMTIAGTKYRPKKTNVNIPRQTFQGFAVGNYDENGTQSQSLNNTVRIITDAHDNYTEIITRDKDRINWNGYVQGQIMWVTD